MTNSIPQTERAFAPATDTAIAVSATSLPAMVKRAVDQLASATNAAEVLDARDTASVVYDAAKKAARLAKAKGAHDTLIATAHRAQADALEIEATAKRRLADEYDAAQERGEVRTRSDNQHASSKAEEAVSAADIGLTHKDIHEARIIRDAEAADPGIVRRTIDEKLAAGEEPTKAAVKAAVTKAVKKTKTKGKSRPSAADQAEFDRQRAAAQAALPQAVKDSVEAAENAKAKAATPAVEKLQARVSELEDYAAGLESDIAAAKLEISKFADMKVQYEKGGFEAVIAGKDEEIRVLQTRVYRESEDKVGWKRSADYWKGEALKLGYADKDSIDIDTGEFVNG